VACTADGSQGGSNHSFGVSCDAQPAVFADDHELATDPVFELMQRAAAPADFLVRDQLECYVVRQAICELAEGLPSISADTFMS
jgi:hypothetical protein